MRTIYKYPFDVDDEVILDLPDGAEILKVECQGRTPCLWAMVDTRYEDRSRHFRVFGTGQPIDVYPEIKLTFIGTFQQPPFVWHLFEVAS